MPVSGEGNLAYGTSAYMLKLTGFPADSGKQLVLFRRPPSGTEVIAVSFGSDLPLPAQTASPPAGR